MPRHQVEYARVGTGKLSTRGRSGSAESDGSVSGRSAASSSPTLRRTNSFASDMTSDVSSEDLDGMSLDDLELLRDDMRRGRNGSDGREAIRVAVRFRPLLPREKNAGAGWFVQPETSTVSQLVPADAYHKRAGIYAFDEVYDEQHSTQSIYDGMARTIARSALDGIHGSIFAYGQTSSGKTHTMQGTSLRATSSSSSSSSRSLHGNQEETEADRRPMHGDGIVQLAVKDLFDEMARRSDASFSVRVSYMEIYNETVRDLLDPSNGSVSVREHPVTGVFTDNSERIVSDARGVLKALRDGEKNRSVGSTAMNERSSRSHSIFRVVIESRTRQMDDASDNQSPKHGAASNVRVALESVRVGCLNFVDLAGSESARMTGAKGKRAAEASSINRSLLALSRVVSALSSRRRNGSSGASSPHINFRDSKLTRILQPSLSGSARVLFICCASPANHLAEDTRNTLKFATRAKRIKLNVTVNEVTDQQTRALAELKQENQQLREQMERIAAQDADKMSAMEHLTADLRSHIEVLELAMAQMRSGAVVQPPPGALDALVDASSAPVNAKELDPASTSAAHEAVHVVVIDEDDEDTRTDRSQLMERTGMASPVSSLATTERASMLECCSSCSRLEEELKAAKERNAHSQRRIEQLERELASLKQEVAFQRHKQVEITIEDDEELRGTGDEELADSDTDTDADADADTASDTDSASPLTSPFSPRPATSWRSRVAQATSMPPLVAVTLAAITVYCITGSLAAATH